MNPLNAIVLSITPLLAPPGGPSPSAPAAAPEPGLLRTEPAAARAAALVRRNHGPGTSGGGSAVGSGETLRAGRWALTLRTELTQFDSASDAEATAFAIADGEFDSLERALVQRVGVEYGVTDDFEMGAQIGYYAGTDFVDAEDDGMGGAELSDADPQGLTDLWLEGKWRVHRGPSGHLALMGGVKLPTGKDDERLSNGELLEASSQPGTGAVDFQAGLALSRFLDPRTTLDASALYTLRGEHADFEVGDRVDVGLALAYRLTERVSDPGNWSVFGELTGTWIGKDRSAGAKNENSGGSTIYASLGLRDRIDEHYSVSIAPAIPVSQDLNGDQVETAWRVALTIAVTP